MTAQELINAAEKKGLRYEINTTIETCEYYKDHKGEDWESIKPMGYRNFGAFLNNKAETDYLYLYQNGKWHLKE